MTDTAGLIRTLEDSGLRRQAAEAIASALEEQRRRSAGGVPPWVSILAVGLVAGAIGFLATVTLENSERLARLEEGQQTLKEGQRELVQRVRALEEGQRELVQRVGALEEGQRELVQGQREILRLLRRRQ